MANNMLCVSPTTDRFIDVALHTLAELFRKGEDPRTLELQFKYAELRSVDLLYSDRNFPEVGPQVRGRIEELQRVTTQTFLTQLATLSKQNVLYLNPLARGSYHISAGFDEPSHQKFYRIRDLFKKLDKFNRTHDNRRVPLGQPPHNIYHELSLNTGSHQIRVEDDNELRLDLFVKDPAPQGLQGRYSYSGAGGWVRTNKTPLCQQLDYLMNEHFFRMALNREDETKPDPPLLTQLANFCGAVSRPFDIRLKRSMRVLKGTQFEISLSEVLTLKEAEACRAVGEMVFQPNLLEDYMRRKFIGFYGADGGEAAWEIELELSKKSNVKLKQLAGKGKFTEMRVELETAMSELMALFYADHAIKTKEVDWLVAPSSEPRQQGRLDNEFGTYMREHLYRQMSQ